MAKVKNVLTWSARELAARLVDVQHWDKDTERRLRDLLADTDDMNVIHTLDNDPSEYPVQCAGCGCLIPLGERELCSNCEYYSEEER